MRLTRVVMTLNNQTLEALRNSIKKTISDAPNYINKVKNEQKKIVYDKLIHLNKWYTKIIGLDEVKVYQNRVTALQEQLLNTQQKRRDVGRQLAEVRQKSMILQDEIHKVKRQDEFEKFLELMKQETEILKLEKSVTLTFQEYDQTERELFTAFSNAIRDSHEKQRAQLEYTKYFGLILSITGSFLAFVYTSVKKHDLKKFIENQMSYIINSKIPTTTNSMEANDWIIGELKRNSQKLNEVVAVLSSAKYNPNMPPNTLNTMEIPNSTWNDMTYIKIGGAVLCSLLLFSIILR